MKDIHGTKIVCIALVASMFSLILIPAGYAAIGVEEGDWVKYDVEAEVEGPEEMVELWEAMEEMEWVKVKVESVSDTTVTAEETIHYKNGTETTMTIEDAIDAQLIIEADLGEGDEVTAPSFGAEMPVYINGTVSRTYAGASREVNYIDITVTQNGMTSTTKAYWDKATGIICEMSMSISGEVAGETIEMSMLYKMTGTNVWEAEPLAFITQWWFYAIVAVGIVALVGAVYFLKKRRQPTPTAPAPPSEGTETSID